VTKRNKKNTITDQIYRLAEEILEKDPSGVRYSDLWRQISERDETLKVNTVKGTVLKAESDDRNSIAKPSPGLYVHSRYLRSTDSTADVSRDRSLSRESAFYPSLAEWMERELEGVTKAVELGGSLFPGKWGTPDVIGKKVSVGEIFEEQMELISAEVKFDSNQLVTAFGQACAYCLFSHRSYVVVPKGAAELDRLQSLCQVFGIGLVLFNKSCVERPSYELKLRARRQEPDYFYVNQVARQVKGKLFT